MTRHVAGHVTFKLREGLPSLRVGRFVRALEASFSRGAERGDFRLVHYSIQADHLHAIIEASDRGALGRGMMALATRVARAVNRVFGRRGPVFRDRYHLRLLRTPLEVRRALAYVLLNASKHLRRLAPKIGTIDPASSGAWFDGWRHGAQRGVARPPPVAAARSWLVRIGWRRHGLLDPSEVPGLAGVR
jgi:REP element-mobilizing transposase RayT